MPNINKTKISKLFKYEGWDSNARKIISRISDFDNALNEVEFYEPLQLVSTNKKLICENQGVYINDFNVDVDLKDKCVFINKELDIDSQTIFSILASYSAQQHLIHWPSLPKNNDIMKYQDSVARLNTEIDNGFSNLFSEILEKTTFERKQTAYHVSFKTTSDMFFGKNEHLNPTYRNRPNSSIAI